MNKSEILNVLESCRQSFRVLPTREMVDMVDLTRDLGAEVKVEAAIVADREERARKAKEPKPILNIKKKAKKKAKKKK